MMLILQQRNYGRMRTVEIDYSECTRAEFYADVRSYLRRLRMERAGQIRDDSPILVDVLIVRH